jgi:hypothetical protein
MGLSVNDRFSPEMGLPYADAETDAAGATPQGLEVNADGWSVLQSLPVSVSAHLLSGGLPEYIQQAGEL